MAQKKKDKRNRKLEPGITQRADGTYCFRQRLKGEKPICVYAKTLEEIRAKKKEIEENRGRNVRANSGDMLLDELAKEYFDEKMSIRDTTKTQYAVSYKTKISPYLGGRKINSLQNSDFAQLFKKLSALNLKYKSMEQIKIVATQIMKWGVVNEYIKDYSCVANGWSIFRDRREPVKIEKVHALTTEEQTAVMRFLASDDKYKKIHLIFTVLLGTGMRCGECFALTWDDVNFESEEINVDKTLVYCNSNGKYEFSLNEPKTESGTRIIPMFPQVKAALLELKNEEIFPPCKTIINGVSGFVFSNYKQEVYIPYNLNTRIKEIVNLCNEEELILAKKENRPPLQVKPFSLHCLRHTFATNYCQLEPNPKTVQAVLGHSDISITFNLYVDAKKENIKESFRTLAEKMFIC